MIPCRSRAPVGARDAAAFQPLQFLHERFYLRSDVPPFGLRFALLLAKQRELVHERRGVVPLELALQLGELAHEVVTFLFELRPLVAELLDQGGGLFDPLGEAVEIGHHHDCFGHRVLKWPPWSFSTAATMRFWMASTSGSVMVRSSCWNSRA